MSLSRWEKMGGGAACLFSHRVAENTIHLAGFVDGVLETAPLFGLFVQPLSNVSGPSHLWDTMGRRERTDVGLLLGALVDLLDREVLDLL